MLLQRLKNKKLLLATQEVELGIGYPREDQGTQYFTYSLRPKAVDPDSFKLEDLTDLLEKIDPKGLSGQLGELFGAVDAVNPFQLTWNSFSIGDFVSVGYASMELTIGRPKKEGHSAVRLDLKGASMDLDLEALGLGTLNIRGSLQFILAANKEVLMEFVIDADNEQPAIFAFSLPLIEEAFNIQLQLSKIRIGKQKNSGRYGLSTLGTLAISGGPDYLASIWPSTPTNFELGMKGSGVALSIPSLFSNQFIDLPTISVLDKNIELGKLLVDIKDLTLSIGTETGLAATVLLGLPTELDHYLKTLGLPSILKTGGTEKFGSHISLGLSAGFQAKLLGSPFKMDWGVDSPIRIIEKRSGQKMSWEVFLGKDGKNGKIQINDFLFSNDPNSSALLTSGSFKILEPLVLPTSFVKRLLEAVGLSPIAGVLPDGIPLKDVELVKDGKLNFPDALKDQLPDVFQYLLAKPDALIGKLPDKLQDYLTIIIPDQLDFKLKVNAEGSISGEIILPEGQYLKLLIPSDIFLYGVTLQKISIGQVSALASAVVNVTATIHQFNLPEIATAYIANQEAKDLVLTLELYELLMFVPNAFPVPIPVFYDKLGLDYKSITGLKLGSTFKFPKPKVDPLKLANTFIQFGDFLTKKEVLLDTNSTAVPNLEFTVGANYLELPSYLGGQTLGQKSTIVKIDAWENIAKSLNFFKTGSLKELIGAVPLKYRMGGETVQFLGLLEFNAKWLFVSVDEIKKGKVAATIGSEEKLLAVVEDNKADDGALTLLGGAIKIGPAFSLDALFGLAISNNGFATKFQMEGILASTIKLELEGGIVMTTGADFELSGSSKLLIGETPIMNGVLEVRNDLLYVRGMLDLFPSSPVVLKSDIAGEISKDTFSLSGAGELQVAGVTIVDGSLTINAEELRIKGAFLTGGMSLVLAIPASVNEPLEAKGTVNLFSEIPFISLNSNIEGSISKDKIDLSADVGLDIAGLSITNGSFKISSEQVSITIGFLTGSMNLTLNGLTSTKASLDVKGMLNLFPVGSPLVLNSDIAGTISKSDLSLRGDTKLKVDGITVVEGVLELDKEQILIKGAFLGLSTMLLFDSTGGFSGKALLQYNFDVEISIPPKYNFLNLSSLPGFVEAELEITITVTDTQTCTLQLSAGFFIRGYHFTVKSTMDDMPSSLNAIKESIEDKIITKIEEEITTIWSDSLSFMADTAKELGKALDAGYRAAENVKNAAYNTAKKTWDSAYNTAEETWDDAYGLAEDAWDDAYELATNFWGVISGSSKDKADAEKKRKEEAADEEKKRKKAAADAEKIRKEQQADEERIRRRLQVDRERAKKAEEAKQNMLTKIKNEYFLVKVMTAKMVAEKALKKIVDTINENDLTTISQEEIIAELKTATTNAVVIMAANKTAKREAVSAKIIVQKADRMLATEMRIAKADKEAKAEKVAQRKALELTGIIVAQMGIAVQEEGRENEYQFEERERDIKGMTMLVIRIIQVRYIVEKIAGGKEDMLILLEEVLTTLSSTINEFGSFNAKKSLSFFKELVQQIVWNINRAQLLLEQIKDKEDEIIERLKEYRIRKISNYSTIERQKDQIIEVATIISNLTLVEEKTSIEKIITDVITIVDQNNSEDILAIIELLVKTKEIERLSLNKRWRPGESVEILKKLETLARKIPLLFSLLNLESIYILRDLKQTINNIKNQLQYDTYLREYTFSYINNLERRVIDFLKDDFRSINIDQIIEVVEWIDEVTVNAAVITAEEIRVLATTLKAAIVARKNAEETARIAAKVATAETTIKAAIKKAKTAAAPFLFTIQEVDDLPSLKWILVGIK